MSNNYRIYGLALRSDLAIPGLCALPQVPPATDLHLELAAQPTWVKYALGLPITAVRSRPALLLPGDPAFSVTEFASGQYFLLTYGDGTRFVTDHACACLWGEPGPGLSHEDLCVYLLGPVMGFILRKRGFSPLHASAVSIRGDAIALVGEAGAGKSTTAAALALRGWPVLCEDVCAFDECGGKFLVRPAYPRVSLWPDSTEFLFSSQEALPLIVQGWEKRFLPLDGTRAYFAGRAAPLSAIFLLAARSTDKSAPYVEPISARVALLQLVQDTYMNWLLNSHQRALEFDVLTRLVTSVGCFRVTPSSDPARLPLLADLIEAQTLRMVAPDQYPAIGLSARNV